MSATSQAGAMTTEELFRQHAPFVGRFLARLGVPPEQARDALQEVFLVVHRNGGYRPGVAKPTSYLASIAIHAANKHRRRERADRLRHSEACPEQVASESADPTRALQTQQELARLQLALDRLPDELRTTLVLVEIEGESCLSVAAALGWPVGTVYWRLHEARKKLQLALRSIDAAREAARALPGVVASQPALAERRRALGVPNLGIIMLFGADSRFQRSEAGQLLRLAREQPSALGGSEALLARHLELVRAGADLPGWAASYVPHAATWFGLIGLGGAGSIAALAVAGLASALLLSAQEPEPRPAAAVVRVTPPPAAAPRSAITPEPAAPPEPPARALASPSHSTSRARPESERAPHDMLNATSARALGATPPVASEPEPAAAFAAHAARRVPPQQPPREPSVARAAAEPTRTTAVAAPEHPAPARAASPARSEDSAAGALREMQEIASAERLLKTAPARALTIVRAVEARFPEGYLREERAYVEVMALLELGRAKEARSKAEAFLKTYPDGPYSRRVHSATVGTAR